MQDDAETFFGWIQDIGILAQFVMVNIAVCSTGHWGGRKTPKKTLIAARPTLSSLKIVALQYNISLHSIILYDQSHDTLPQQKIKIRIDVVKLFWTLVVTHTILPRTKLRIVK
ncbi:MAG: hypothetical protein PHX61_11500 [Alphaproteobacteria bacterium]|nr:hypothetical protein [Alphaproteobacteria bacterium]